MTVEETGQAIEAPPADGSTSGEWSGEWKEVRDPESGELLAWGRRIDEGEARRLARQLRAMPGGGSGEGLPPTDPGFEPDAGRALLFDGRPMRPGHYHFALALAEGETASPEPDSRVEQRRTARAERKASRNRARARGEAARSLDHARASRKAQRRAGVRRGRARGRRSLGRRR